MPCGCRVHIYMQEPCQHRHPMRPGAHLQVRGTPAAPALNPPARGAVLHLGVRVPCAQVCAQARAYAVAHSMLMCQSTAQRCRNLRQCQSATPSTDRATCTIRASNQEARSVLASKSHATSKIRARGRSAHLLLASTDHAIGRRKQGACHKQEACHDGR